MALEWKKCFLSVPLDEQGLSDYDNWSDSDGHIYTVELTVSEYEALIEVFSNVNMRYDRSTGRQITERRTKFRNPGPVNRSMKLQIHPGVWKGIMQ